MVLVIGFLLTSTLIKTYGFNHFELTFKVVQIYLSSRPKKSIFRNATRNNFSIPCRLKVSFSFVFTNPLLDSLNIIFHVSNTLCHILPEYSTPLPSSSYFHSFFFYIFIFFSYFHIVLLVNFIPNILKENRKLKFFSVTIKINLLLLL